MDKSALSIGAGAPGLDITSGRTHLSQHNVIDTANNSSRIFSQREEAWADKHPELNSLAVVNSAVKALLAVTETECTWHELNKIKTPYVTTQC